MNISFDNETTAAIDAQFIVAPQYGVKAGSTPHTDPTNDGPSKNGPNQGPRKEPSTSQRCWPRKAAYNVQSVRTRDLKMDRSILVEFVAMVRAGTLLVSNQDVAAMVVRLELMVQELAHRDVRDYSARKNVKMAA